MRLDSRIAMFISCLPLLCTGVAWGGEGIQVKVTNDGTADIVVTVFDMNSHPKRVLLENERINGFTSVPITVIVDSTGRANLSWTATSIDKNSRQCGHDQVALSDDSALNVHADSSCSV